jgi:hypothetical protein
MKKTFFQSLVCAFTLAVFSMSTWAEDECAGSGSRHSAIAALCDFKEGMAKFKINGQWGFFNLKAEVAIAPQFDEVTHFSEGLASAKTDEKWGIIDTSGQWVVKPQWQQEPGAYKGGLSDLCEGDKCGYIDRKGQWVIAPKFSRTTEFIGPVAVVYEESVAPPLLIDTKGRVIKRFPEGVDLQSYSHGFGLISAEQKFPRVLYHLDGRRQPVPQAAPPFHLQYSEGTIQASQEIKQGDESVERYGVIDLSGKWLIKPQFKSLKEFYSGVAIAQLALEKSIPDTSESRGAWTLIDKQGRQLTKTLYQDITRIKNRGFVATASKSELKDIFSPQGRLLLSTGCAEIESLDSYASDQLKHSMVIQGCDQTWVLPGQGGVVKSAIKNKAEVSSNDQYVLLVEPSGSGQDTKLRRFEFYNTAGKLVFSSDSAAMSGVQGFGPEDVLKLMPTAPPNAPALPMAFIIKDYKTIGLITPDFKHVSNPDWEYESNFSYRQNRHDSDTQEGPLPMKTDALWGAVDAYGAWVIEPKFRRLSVFSQRTAKAYAFDSDRQLIVTAEGQTQAVPENTGDFSQTGPYTLQGSHFSDRQAVYINMKTGVVKTLDMPPESVNAAMHNGLMAIEKNRQWGLMNEQGQWVLPAQFTSRIEPVLHDKKLIGWTSAQSFQSTHGSGKLYGWLSPEGQQLVKPLYTGIKFIENAGVLQIDQEGDGFGLMTVKGQVLIEPTYKEVNSLGDGWFSLEPSELRGLVNAQGEWAFAPVSQFYFSDSRGELPFAKTQRHGEKWLMSIDGQSSTKASPAALSTERPQWWWNEVKNQYKDNQTTVFYGFDFKERLRTPHHVSEFDKFSEGVITVKPQKTTRMANVGLIDTTGKVLGMYPFQGIRPMREGMAVFAHDPKAARRGAALQEGETKLGYINRQGKPSIAPQFDMANDFSQGRAVVVFKGNFGIIDNQGKLLAHSAWQCGKKPVVFDGHQKVMWPLEAKVPKKCP